ncbi:L-type lectin-domain containing protein [Candidatus Enterococcus mansonii]|uniref:WxL domain-containing protein n=1 Tax=Candidatus Enterococcus mansonii TaxID=1834181 RepID=A0A242CC50_9ENTE|nr:L-type lectin-domain containing protein [Enterococcus sp. 4G2_DIV0659]OTO07835.1 hypothetical protein A5880_002105 [Enterococcus sp. 4G2_DIV0659]
MFRNFKKITFFYALAIGLTLSMPSQAEAIASEDAPQSVPLTDIFKVPAGAHSTVRGNTVIITDAETERIGSIFSTEINKVDLSKDFEAEMYINLEGTADGVTFVFHNDADRAAKFDGTNGATGNAMGAYAHGVDSNYLNQKILRRQLKSSFAIEFDTYLNGDNFDADILRNEDRGHVAYAFPDQVDSYVFNWNQSLKVNHQGLQYPSFPLGDGKWRLLKVHWKTWNASNYGVLTYEYEGLDPVEAPIHKNTFKFSPGGSEKVYWGFTGSTGALTEKAMVAFRSVPGLVNYEDSVKLLNAKGLPATTTKAVAPTEEVTVQYSGKYTGGIQNLLSPVLKLTLSAGQVYQPGTLIVNGQSVTPTVIGNTLSIPVADLSLTSSKLDVVFNVRNPSIGVTTDQNITSQMVGSNYISPELVSSYKVDAIKPKGEGKISLIDLGDTQAITAVADYTKFLKDWSDDISAKANIKVSLKAGQDIEGLVNTIGPDFFVVELTDEVGNKADVDVPVFIKDPNDAVSQDNKHLLHGDGFTVFTKDYPTTKAAVETMIRDKGKLNLWRVDPFPPSMIANTSINIASTTLPVLNGASTVKEGIYKVTLTYGTGTSQVTKTIDVNIKNSVGKVTVDFVNEAGVSIDKSPTKLVLEGDMDTTINLSLNPEVKKRIADIENDNYRLVGRPADETAVLIVGENVVVEYEFTGYLSLATAPTSLDFKVHSGFIEQKRISEPEVIGSNLVVSDTRVTKEQWNLKAKIITDLQSEDGTQKMTDVIKYKNAKDEVTLNDASSVIYTPDTITANKYDITEDRWKAHKEGFFLDFPAGSLKALGKYKAQLEITLENAK